jgi:hypothetical protein
MDQIQGQMTLTGCTTGDFFCFQQTWLFTSGDQF